MYVYVNMLELLNHCVNACVEERSDQDQHKFFTQHIAVFIRALSGSNTEKKWT